jgi:SAM-dependent methyltransferase
MDDVMDKGYTGDREVLLKYLPRDSKVYLDVGCAYGEFGKLLKARRPGAVVWGVEPVKEAAVVAASALDKVVNDFFNQDTAVPDNFFDAITFNDSLEHFPEPYSPLQLAKRKLKTNGTLICCVPNVRYVENIKNLLFAKDWRYTAKGILDDTHLRFFTTKSLRRTITEAGYEVVHITGINDYWDTGWKTKVILPLLGGWAQDMKHYQLVAVAKPNSQS